ncbi:MAG: aldose 1-epimerase family protein [Bryobacteraceae bacterium]|nr:aldose 1-epimerase family protein [Bryobacteraceae bacterium]
MPEIEYLGRRAVSLANGLLEVIVTIEGGHIAAIRDLATGVNPLWTPPWPTIEPSAWDPARHPEYGDNPESRLLAGILGHNLCLDLWGAPSAEEAAAGMHVHGEAGVIPHEVRSSDGTLEQAAVLPASQLRFERRIRLRPGARRLEIEETVENLSPWDRPVAWTQHVTLGPPFLEKGKTEFRANATRSKVIEHDFTGGKGHMQTGAEFDWPLVPCLDGSLEDMQVFTSRAVSAAFTTHLMDPRAETAWFAAWHPELNLTLGYAWKQADFPWLGIWEENCSRTAPPWNGVTLARGMEFGVSPFPESRRAMIDRGSLFGVKGYRWVPARTRVTVQYEAWLEPGPSAG